MVMFKKQQPKQETKEYAEDLGSVSLWVNHGKGSHIASGLVTLADGSVMRLYLYETANKKSDRSPDYYGFLKEMKEQPTSQEQDEEEEAKPTTKRGRSTKSSGDSW
jgi:hypothetical protein